MTLYMCAFKTFGGSWPLVQHPCGQAAQALDTAGHAFTEEVVGGFKSLPFSRRGRRDEIRALTGQDDVPVLLLDDGTTVTGAKAIVAWAAANPAGAS